MKALTKQDLRCPTTGKASFVDRETADREVNMILKRAGYEGRVPRKVYACQHCGWWHLSSAL